MEIELKKVASIEELSDFIILFNKKYYPESNLYPIFGGGKKHCPKIMFIFINPTKKNIATDPHWKGQRVPWIGIKPIWKILFECGFLSDEINAKIQISSNNWDTEFVDTVYNEIENSGIYLTNIVKWAGEDATLPEKDKIERYLPILKKEITLVDPNLIITMGQIPFRALTKNNQKLDFFYQEFLKTNKLQLIDYVNNSNKITPILPCYFPVGMGRFNRNKAIEILKHVQLFCKD